MRISKSMARKIVITAALLCFGPTFIKEAALLVAQTGSGTVAPARPGAAGPANASTTGATPTTTTAATTTADAAKYRAFVDKYCVSCHNQRTAFPADGPVRLDAAGLDDLLGPAENWEEGLPKLSVRAKPPQSPPPSGGRRRA